MAELEMLFPTLLYRARLDLQLNAELEKAVLALALEDRAGIAWCRTTGYKGYTSYASIQDLSGHASAFTELARQLEQHAAVFANGEFDMGSRHLALDGMWASVMETGSLHAGHMHPHCVLSGTYYVSMPPGAGPIIFEDPRLGFMMASPPRRPGNGAGRQNFVALVPEPATVLLWESWLRHSVEVSQAKEPRISISFNYRIA